MRVYVGTYTQYQNGKGKGIYAFDFDERSGTFTAIGTTTGLDNPAWLQVNEDKSVLYAALEGEAGQVAAFRIDPVSGALSEINRVSSEGASPCYISLSHDEATVFVANYTSGTIAALPIRADGGLDTASDSIQREGASVDPDRQQGPHAHMILSSPGGKYILVTDLGTDEITSYQFDAEGGLFVRGDGPPIVISLTAGAGPRHFAFSPDGGKVYVINELGSTLAVFDFDEESGALRPLQTVSTLPVDFEDPNYPAQVLVSPDGRFVYGSNRLHDSIAVWKIDEETGTVITIGNVPTQGTFPRNFAIDPSGKWLVVANQNSDSLVTFARDVETGELAQRGDPLSIPSPVCILFL